jgi:Histidine kinase
MWISNHLRLSHAHSELETLVLERTAELQKLSQRLLKVQDEERRKIARDLHDSTGQTLTALKIGISFLQNRWKEDPASLAIISAIAYSGDVNRRFQRDVNGHSGHVNKSERSDAGITIMPDTFEINQGARFIFSIVSFPFLSLFRLSVLLA